MPTILIADDMAIIREPIAMALQKHGYRTVCVADGFEAVSAVSREKPDLILLDVSMPRMNGIDVLHRLRSRNHSKDIPIIMLTEDGSKKRIVEASKMHVSGWVLKGNFSLSDLLKRIAEALPTSSRPLPEESGAPAGTVEGDARDEGATVTPTVVIKMPEKGESLKEMKPMMRRSDVQEALDHCGELKGLSPIAAHILKLSAQEDCSIEAVAKAIKQDQAISLKILKLANSSVYDRGAPVDTVHKAVTRIGLSQIHQTVLNISVVEKFSALDESEHLNAPQFWEHSIATGLIAAEITRKLKGKDEEVESAFTMGLLHDVGRMVYVDLFGEEYLQVLDVAQRLQLPVEQVESRLLLINHADAMDRVLHSWNFPKALINPIAFHHLSMGNIRQMSPRNLQEVATLALANRLAHALLLGSSGNPTLYPIEEYMAALKLDAEFVKKIEGDVPDQTSDIKFAMLSHSGGQTWPELRAKLQSQLKQPFRPIVVSPDTDVDPIRIFCDRLAVPLGEDEGPNIAIVRLNKARDRDVIVTNLRQSEKEMGVDLLPLVVLSPTGELQLDEKAMAGRRVQLLPFPLTVACLVEAINEMSQLPRSNAAA